MDISTLAQYGLPPLVVAVIFMFKMYLDARQRGRENNQVEAMKTQLEALRQENSERERREEIKPLASAINKLSMSINEIHVGQKQQTTVLEKLVNKLT